jgi:PAS domain S-box-containing protein
MEGARPARLAQSLWLPPNRLGRGNVMVSDFETDRITHSLVDDRQYRLLVESITDFAIYMLDLDGRIASWNAGAERSKGYTSAEIVGHNFSIFYTLEDRAKGEPQRALDTAASEGRFESEGWRIRKDGSRFWASVVVDPIRENGQILGFAKITRDISDRKESERALAHANPALLQSQKMEAVGQLTGGIAHDFNNLLTAVLGSLELLRKRLASDSKAMRLLENAVQGARRGSALTRRLLAFARYQDLSPEAVDLPNLVRGMTALMQPVLGPKTIIETHLPRQSNAVLVDFNQLEMALLNLAVNARDAMTDGGTIVIDVREARLAQGQVDGLAAGSYACLSVKDSGVGMDEITLSRAMEPFYTTKGPGKGTGLGLSMVHGVMIQANGRLILNSEVGKGTTAELWLPLMEGAVATTGTALPAPGRALDGTNRLVLAVDDDELVLLNTVMVLEDLGHKVFEAASGKEALAVLAREPSIELVVTDMAMPHMSGTQLFEVAQNLYPRLRFLLAAGYMEASDDDQPMLLRITKPFWQDDLARAIQVVFETEPPDARVIQFPMAAVSQR